MTPAQQRAILESVAANIRRIRAERGLSQFALAERSGVELRVLQRIEGAGGDFMLLAFFAIAAALDVEIGLLATPAHFEPRGRGRPPKARE